MLLWRSLTLQQVSLRLAGLRDRPAATGAGAVPPAEGGGGDARKAQILRFDPADAAPIRSGRG